MDAMGTAMIAMRDLRKTVGEGWRRVLHRAPSYMNLIVLRGFLVDGKPDSASKRFREGLKFVRSARRTAASNGVLRRLEGALQHRPRQQLRVLQGARSCDQKEPVDLFDPELLGLTAAIGIRKRTDKAGDAPAGRSDIELPPLNAPPPILTNEMIDSKLDFARKVLSWTQDRQPIELFKPEEYGNSISPMESKLLEAYVVLETVPDSPADAAAKQQAQDRRNYVSDKVADIGKDLMMGKAPDPKDLAVDVLVTVAKPTKLGDGQSAAREHLKREIGDELRKYAEKRDPCMKNSFAPACIKAPPPEGPVLNPAP
ncbi:hypothetical protein [Mesorhizobium sp.]|uniref:hypothetical protein n=1 Tax=Mesorhizobium sp. TaxID=1871066 RepID=UPI00257AB3D8|nr:hypothetical protein [Mesorhizobium sp.]